MSPRVAIITPTYQHASFVQPCIQSAIDQSVGDWEMVVVDDGSTDGTPDAVRGFGDPRIQVIQREHQGLAGLGDAYAMALRATSAPLIAVLEGDDSWPPDKLARQLSLLDDPELVLSYGAAALLDAKGRPYATYDRWPGGRVGNNDPIGSIIPQLIRTNFIVSATVIVRRAALERVGGFWQPEGFPFVDHPTWLRLALEGRFAHCDELVGRWRRHPSQYTTVHAPTPALDPTPYIVSIYERAIANGVAAIDQDALSAFVRADAGRRVLRARTGAGRLQLLAGDWSDARRTFRGLLTRNRSPSSAAIGLLGWISASLHLDIEWLFRATGRLSWPPRQ